MLLAGVKANFAVGFSWFAHILHNRNSNDDDNKNNSNNNHAKNNLHCDPELLAACS